MYSLFSRHWFSDSRLTSTKFIYMRNMPITLQHARNLARSKHGADPRAPTALRPDLLHRQGDQHKPRTRSAAPCTAREFPRSQLAAKAVWLGCSRCTAGIRTSGSGAAAEPQKKRHRSACTKSTTRLPPSGRRKAAATAQESGCRATARLAQARKAAATSRCGRTCCRTFAYPRAPASGGACRCRRLARAV